MSKGWKIALFIGGLVALTLSLVIGGAYYWFQRNEGRLKEEFKQATEEGRRFGDKKTGPDCEQEGLRRLDDCDSLLCGAMNSVFMKGCLDASTLTRPIAKGFPEKMKSSRAPATVSGGAERRGAKETFAMKSSPVCSAIVGSSASTEFGGQEQATRGLHKTNRHEACRFV